MHRSSHPRALMPSGALGARDPEASDPPGEHHEFPFGSRATLWLNKRARPQNMTGLRAISAQVMRTQV